MMRKIDGIPECVIMEIDFMLGSIEECNSDIMVEILSSHGVYPEGKWINIDTVSDEVITDIYNKLFKTGIVSVFFTE